MLPVLRQKRYLFLWGKAMTKGSLGSRGEYMNTKELHPTYPEDCRSPSSVLIEQYNVALEILRV
jgi:hypothetical protein